MPPKFYTHCSQDRHRILFQIPFCPPSFFSPPPLAFEWFGWLSGPCPRPYRSLRRLNPRCLGCLAVGRPGSPSTPRQAAGKAYPPCPFCQSSFAGRKRLGPHWGGWAVGSFSALFLFFCAFMSAFGTNGRNFNPNIDPATFSMLPHSGPKMGENGSTNPQLSF